LTARRTVQAAIRAIDRSDWDGLLDLFAPGVLEELKSDFVNALRRSLAIPAMQTPEHTATLRELYLTSDPTELLAMAPRDVARWIMPQHPKMFPMHPSAKAAKVVRRVLGEVPEGPRTVHVVYRLSMTARLGKRSLSSDRLEVATVRRHRAHWLLTRCIDFQSPGIALKTWVLHEAVQAHRAAAV
jgi:hypothetical protein